MTASTIEIRPLGRGDFEAVMSLVEVCYGGNAEPPEWWEWRHFDEHLDAPVILGAVEGSKVLGIRPLTIFPFRRAGEALVGAVFSAVMVHPEHRRRGIFSNLVAAGARTAWDRGAAFLMTMPNDLSALAFRKLGWAEPGLRTLLVRPIDHAALVGTRFGRGWMSSALGTVMRTVLRRGSLELECPGVGIAEVDELSSAADELAERCCNQYPGLIMRRSREWWGWRFRQNPWRLYRRFEARHDRGFLEGVLVTAGEHRDGLEVGYVADVLAEKPGVRRAMIGCGARALAQDGAQVIVSVVTDRTLVDDFKAAGFFEMPPWLSPKKFRTMFVPSPSRPELRDTLGDIGDWYLTLADWDGI